MVHIFDVDDTIIKNTSMWYFLLEALKLRVIRFSQIRRLPVEWFKYKLSCPDMDFIENTVKNLAGIEKSALEDIAVACFERSIKKRIYTGAQKLIREALHRGQRVIFATSSIDIVIRPLERFFGIEETLATKLEFRDGRTTGSLVGNSMFGLKKKTGVEAWLQQKDLHPEKVCFYSDSYTDIPLLEYCGNPVAVNPDRILKREAKKRGWKILHFKELT